MKKIAIFGAIIAIVVFGIIAAAGSSTPTATVIVDTSKVQEVELSMDGYTYQVSSELQAGIPVKMTVDLDTVNGCMRDIRIPAFGVSKYVTESDNIVEFTPTRSGTFNIMCSMNMGRGQFEVVEEDGTASAYEEPAPTEQTCGVGACGCGL